MRVEKKAIVEEIRANLDGASYVFIVDYRGLSSGQIANLRARFRALQVSPRIAKNTYIGKAVEGFEWDDVTSGLAGPSMTLAGKGEVVEAAKLLKKFFQEHQSPVFKTGLCDGKKITAEDFEALVDLPSKEVLRGMFVGAVAAPMTSFVGVMKQKVSSLLYVLNAAGNKKEESNNS